MLGKRKMAKHFDLAITDTSFDFTRMEEPSPPRPRSMASMWCGPTCRPRAARSRRYRARLQRPGQVERAFRTIKTVEWRSARSIIVSPAASAPMCFLCMLAYYSYGTCAARSAPILFDDHDKPAAEAARGSHRRQGGRSEAAKRKVDAKRTDDDLPVHSFQSLLPISPPHPQHHGDGRQLADLRALSKAHPRSGARLPLLDVPTAL